MLSHFGIGLAAAIGHFVVVVIVLGISRRPRPWTTQLASIILWILAIAIQALYEQSGSIFWYSLSLLGLSFASLAFVYAAVSKSVSLAILNNACRANVQIPLATISLHLVHKEFAARTKLLLDSGLIEIKTGKYCITSKGRTLAKIFERIRTLFGIDTGPFYGLYSGTKKDSVP